MFLHSFVAQSEVLGPFERYKGHSLLAVHINRLCATRQPLREKHSQGLVRHVAVESNCEP